MTDRRDDAFDPSIPLGTAVFRSWSSMKNPVMAWLIYLNILYLFGFFFLDHDEAMWALVSYVAIGPLIVVMFISQRGLTRLTGLIHLPWLAYVVYLAIRLFTDWAGAAVDTGDGTFFFYWIQLVFWSTAICVAFDMWDVYRWTFKRERFVLGTPAAAASNASKLARQD